MKMLAFTLAFAVAVLGSSGDALAHKMKLFATAEGAVVSGYVYFSPGGRAQDAQIAATAADGATVFSGRTDAQGGFRFEVQRRADYRIAADGGDGHEAHFTITAAELPQSLPAEPAPTPTTTAAPPSSPPPTAAVAPAPPLPDLAALVEQSVARQIRPLREQLDSYQETLRWHDVLGGLGYIIGLGGLAYGFASRANGRPRRRLAASEKEAAR
ncbi:nickel transport protein [Rhodopseudomonas rhenobacensis]|uniref:Nickel transport protein n=1 Tax=Rhodopseudomonas rhenobacensis TaxID=87461 RepID=A0A7W8DZ37_9BRAD|nr:carboxypeptidase-like regulatory domain-containing protein [Rhodopseudomonas rhenobacensis]MBB5047417.1 nickel transport protein [Rhodopseudomonas rhenobacensis]